MKRVNELCVIDRGEIGGGVVVAGGGGLLRLDRERGAGQRLGVGGVADGVRGRMRVGIRLTCKKD